jgi:hypothetical protein
MPCKIYYSEGRRIKGEEVKKKKRKCVNIVDVKQAMLQRKKEKRREKER